MLFPVRVDAWSSDRTIRVVDTFLYDPSAPPGLHEDPFRVAYRLLADAEVMGMGRSGRHYTNRVELYRPDLHHEITRQIRAQMEFAKQQHRKQVESAEARQSALLTRKKRRARAVAMGRRGSTPPPPTLLKKACIVYSWPGRRARPRSTPPSPGA